MAVLATDNFDRGDSSDLGANWTPFTDDIFPWSSLSIVSQECVDIGDPCGNVYTAISFPDDQYSQVVLRDLFSSASDGIGPMVRGDAATTDSYWIQCGLDFWILYKVKDYLLTLLASGSFSFSDGDVVRLTVSGTDLIATVNGLFLVAVSDSEVTSGGAGIFGSDVFGVQFNSCDDWEGGDLTGGGNDHYYRMMRT